MIQYADDFVGVIARAQRIACRERLTFASYQASSRVLRTEGIVENDLAELELRVMRIKADLAGC